jgi:hypothetical protein
MMQYDFKADGGRVVAGATAAGATAAGATAAAVAVGGGAKDEAAGTDEGRRQRPPAAGGAHVGCKREKESKLHAGRSVFDLSESGRPPPGSGALAPPKQKTKTFAFQGRSPLRAPQAKKILSPKAPFYLIFERFLSVFELLERCSSILVVSTFDSDHMASSPNSTACGRSPKQVSGGWLKVSDRVH